MSRSCLILTAMILATSAVADASGQDDKPASKKTDESWEDLQQKGRRQLDSWRLPEAHGLLTKAIAAARKFPAPDARLLESVGDLGRVCDMMGKYDEARTSLDEALALMAKLDRPDAERIETLEMVARVCGKQSKRKAAQPYLLRALMLRNKIDEATAPARLALLQEIARNHRALGELPEAAKRYDTLLAALVEKHGPHDKALDFPLLDLARVYRGMKRPDLAETVYRRRITIYEKLRGESHSTVAALLDELADCQFEQKKYDEAIKTYERWQSIMKKGGYGNKEGANEAALGRRIGVVRAAQGQHDVAARHFAEAAAIYLKFFPRHRVRGEVLHLLAREQFVLGLFAEARKSLDPAITILERYGADAVDESVRCLVLLGDVESAADQDEASVKAYRRALTAASLVPKRRRLKMEPLRKLEPVLRRLGKTAEADRIKAVREALMPKKK